MLSGPYAVKSMLDMPRHSGTDLNIIQDGGYDVIYNQTSPEMQSKKLVKKRKKTERSRSNSERKHKRKKSHKKHKHHHGKRQHHDSGKIVLSQHSSRSHSRSKRHHDGVAAQSLNQSRTSSTRHHTATTAKGRSSSRRKIKTKEAKLPPGYILNI